MRIQDSSSTDTLTIELTRKPIAATDAITDISFWMMTTEEKSSR